MTLLRSNEVPAPFFQAGDELNSGWFTALGPSAIHIAALNKTLVSWFAVGDTGHKTAQIAAYDHTTGTWSDKYNVGNFLLADDDHGQLALGRDADGYLYAFYGSHASTQPWSISTAPDDITSWTQQAPFSGAQTYPHLVLVGSTLYVFRRNDAVPSRRTEVVSSATPSGGTATFGSTVVLIDYGADSRAYQGETIVVGTDIHFVGTRANAADTERKGVYYYVYKTATGALENHDGSVSTPSGSLPISLATANASYKLFDHGTGQGDVPSLCFDSAGDPHVLLVDNGGSGTAFTLKHIKRTSGTWSSPATVAAITQYPGSSGGFISTYSAVTGAAGTIEAWYINASGDKIRRVRSASGVWSAEETVLAAGSFNLLGNQPVFNATPEMRNVFCEVSNSSADSGAIAAKRYAHGDSGLVSASVDTTAVDANFDDVSVLLGFDQRDATTRFVNDARTCFLVTAVGNAQADTVQSKFGGASLLLDGTGDFLTAAHNTLFSVSQGDFCIEAFVRRNGASKLQAIACKRPATFASEWACYINVTTNVLVFQGFNATVSVVSISGTTALNAGTWYHVAFSRQGSTWRIFLDGALEASGTESGPPVANTNLMHIGRDLSNAARDFNGWIDEFRFTSGNARYTAAFTAPVAAFPRI